MAGADLAGLVGRGARLVDADLRRVDLREADLSQADLTGADLREAQLAGARLAGADLTAARLPDADLAGVDLEGATLDQADLTGADLAAARVAGADLRGALGLSSSQRAALAQAGARVTEASLGELVGRIRPRHAAAAAAVLALGLGSYGAARWLGPGGSGAPATTAAEVRTLPPAEALARFEELADDAELPQDKVAWLLEAAGQARRLGDEAAQERLLRAALLAAGEDVAVGVEVRLDLGTLLSAQGAHAEALALVDPLLDQSRQTAEQRARAVLLYQALGVASGVDTTARVQGVLDGLSALPDAAAELRLALASALAAEGQVDAALEQVARSEALDVSSGTRARVLETRARVLDRGYRLEEAEVAWQVLVAQTVAGTAANQAALLALADLRARMGRQDEALADLEALLAPEVDPRVRMRAWMVRAGIHEARGALPEAARSLQQAIDLGAVDPEMAEEARLSLARLFGADGDAQLAGMLEGLDPQARALIELQAGLGQARARLDEGRAEEARALYEALLARDDLDAVTRRDARIGLGEAWAQEGEIARALAEWRDLLSETARAEERAHLQLRIAEGLMTAGRLDEARQAWQELVQSADPEVAVQGRLGLGRLYLLQGERERARQALQEVADAATDPAWKVRALEELADLVAEEEDLDATLAAWRRVLAEAPPGHAAAGRARLAMVHALGAADRVAEARRACGAAVEEATTPQDRVQATLTCAELDERAGDAPTALSRYAEALAAAAGGPEDLRLDAALGVARLAVEQGRPEQALEAVAVGLAVAAEPGPRLELLDLRVRALDASGQDSAEARAARDALLAQEPEAAVALLVAAAQEARAGGDLDGARARMAQAAEAAPDPDQRAGALLELGDLHLEAGDADAARAAWRAATATRPDDPAVVFQAGMGLAEVIRRGGDPQGAAAALATLFPPDAEGGRWLAEARARALVEAGDPGALAAWEALALLSSDQPEALAMALRGQADAHFAADRFDRALPLYERAGATTSDPALAGWCALGAAEARAALGEDGVDPILRRLARHEDREVATQAAVRRSQRAADQEDWAGALDALDGVTVEGLGAGWDATVTQARASALAGAGRAEEAEVALAQLADRWPGDEEARVTALLARASLARGQGDLSAAEGWARKALEASSDPGFRALAQAQLDELTAEQQAP
ncbi:pentapeptide repeat-containing protein [Myxococcota bacterium]|nr:pentapeptide repeat-containing protein [Myxococcota bacterium]